MIWKGNKLPLTRNREQVTPISIIQLRTSKKESSTIDPPSEGIDQLGGLVPTQVFNV